MFKIIIDNSHTINHYDLTPDETYKILQSSLIQLNDLYGKLDEINEITDEDKIAIYNLIDILWNAQMEADNNDTNH